MTTAIEGKECVERKLAATWIALCGQYLFSTLFLLSFQYPFFLCISYFCPLLLYILYSVFQLPEEESHDPMECCEAVVPPDLTRFRVPAHPACHSQRHKVRQYFHQRCHRGPAHWRSRTVDQDIGTRTSSHAGQTHHCCRHDLSRHTRLVGCS